MAKETQNKLAPVDDSAIQKALAEYEKNQRSYVEELKIKTDSIRKLGGR